MVCFFVDMYFYVKKDCAWMQVQYYVDKHVPLFLIVI